MLTALTIFLLVCELSIGLSHRSYNEHLFDAVDVYTLICVLETFVYMLSASDDLVTLQEVIECQAQLEEEAENLLGGESGNVCTYPQVCFIFMFLFGSFR